MRWLALVLALGGCATTTALAPVCPTLVPYSAQQQAQASAELDKLPPDSVIGQMVTDYIGLRDQVRACRGEKP